MDKRNKIIIDHYGYDHQSRQYIEEMSELTKAINKFWRYQMNEGKINFDQAIENSSDEKDNLIEEIADVQICLNQMIQMLNCKKDVNKVIDFKLNRSLNIIKNNA